jgi:hypothetical protein
LELKGTRFEKLDELYLKSVGLYPRKPANLPVETRVCPVGFKSESIPIVIEPDEEGNLPQKLDENFWICKDTTTGHVLNVQTSEMLNVCRIVGETDCEKPSMPQERYLRLRGMSQCPRNTLYDPAYHSCRNDDFLLAPLTTETFEKCSSIPSKREECMKSLVPIGSLN